MVRRKPLEYVKTNVASTSRNAYYNLDDRALLETVRGRVAKEIRRINQTLGPAYISQVAHNLGLDKSNASARLHELKYGDNPKRDNPEMLIKPFQVGRKWFKIKHAGRHRMPDPKTPEIRRLVDTWAIVECEPPAEQGKLF